MSARAPLLAALAGAAAVTSAGCLGPQVGDEPGTGDAVLPAGSVLPSVDDDPALADQIARFDGVDALIPRISGFAAGAPIHTWDFGPAPDFAAPVYFVVRHTADGFEPVGHPSLVDSLPGDPGYSPYWIAYLVFVTDAYAGEVIPSVAAIDEAVARGLVERPMVQPFAVDCPIVASDVRLELGAGQPPLAPPSHFNVKGRTAAYYDLGLMALDGVRVPETTRYLVRREGGEPLSEPVRGIDMTGDGDLTDSNDIYDVTPGAPAPTPRCRTVTVAVPADTRSIDTTSDETMADLRDARQLFAPGPVAGTVVAYAVTDEVRHCVVQHEDGSP
ncbi:MAG TPA: hypothetical protein VHE35_06635 [Kofleriaceae bacterium]|nr:hypothetical protein [Kofleriaceae bacterium]